MKNNNNNSTAETAAKTFTRTVDAYEGMSIGERIKEQEKDYRKRAMKTEFERLVDAAEAIYGKLSKQAYNDLAAFHMNNERKAVG